eukprot:SAG11_NODE_13183_length_666_cov_1.185185_1_plen_210_part_10
MGTHKGVIQRTHDSGDGSVSTICTVESAVLSVRMDILPRKYNQKSIFEVSFDGTVYASLTIPGSLSTTSRSPCTLILHANTTSSVSEIFTGKNHWDYRWTDDWQLNITLPSGIRSSRTLTFTHRVPSSGASSDVVIDNVVVDGATCGTRLACTCKGDELASGGFATNNYDAQITMAETVSSAAPGYLDYMEITCAHCVVMGAVGAVYPRW